MALPVLPVLKLIALGSIKIVILGLGALLAPVFTVRLVIGGTGESIRLATQWMIEHNQMDQQEADVFLQSLYKVQLAEFTRAQARGLLFAKIKKSTSSMFNLVKTARNWVSSLLSKSNT